MEILSIIPDSQGIRIYGAGGIVFVHESWMNTIQSHSQNDPSTRQNLSEKTENHETYS